MKTIALMLGTAALLAASPCFAAAGETAEDSASTLGPNDWVWNQDAAPGPLSVVVSIPDQRAYVYRGASIVAVSSVSTGKEGKETPTGTYPILQKAVSHKSNMYHAATMPFMERLTWDGVAIHAGANPGFPTSHGCIHVPTGFARKLYGATRIGTMVSVTDQSVVQDDPGLLPADVYADAQAETVQANTAELSTLGR